MSGSMMLGEQVHREVMMSSWRCFLLAFARRLAYIFTSLQYMLYMSYSREGNTLWPPKVESRGTIPPFLANFKSTLMDSCQRTCEYTVDSRGGINNLNPSAVMMLSIVCRRRQFACWRS